MWDLSLVLLVCAASTTLSAIVVRRALKDTETRLNMLELRVRDLERHNHQHATKDAFELLSRSMSYAGYERGWGGYERIVRNKNPGHHGPYMYSSTGQIRRGLNPEHDEKAAGIDPTKVALIPNFGHHGPNVYQSSGQIRRAPNVLDVKSMLRTIDSEVVPAAKKGV